jgi:hypothetical protein
MSKRLREKYPREMTIVLQHRFWELNVTDDRFEVKLTFDGIPERLVVPFAAIKVFFDPSVRYGLQFEDPTQGPDAGEHSAVTGNGSSLPRSIASRSGGARKPRSTKKIKGEAGLAAVPSGPAAQSGTPSVALPRPSAASAPAVAAPTASKGGEAGPAPEKPDDDKPSGGAQILSIDKFRKK